MGYKIQVGGVTVDTDDAADGDRFAMTKDGIKAKRDEFVANLLADPDKYRKDWDAKARAENPHMTQEQLDASWEQLAHQFGL
jgi:hypothetical protein